MPKSTARKRAAKAGKAKSAVAGRRLAAVAKPASGKVDFLRACCSQPTAGRDPRRQRARRRQVPRARDFTFIDAAGQVHSRRSVLNALKASPRGTGTRIKLCNYGRLAVITGSYKSAQAGERNDLFAIDVWILEPDGWKALIHHNNVLARPDATAAHAASTPRPADAPPPRCANPLEVVPYGRKRRPSAISSPPSNRWSAPSPATIRAPGIRTSRMSSWSPAPASIRPTRPLAWRSWNAEGDQRRDLRRRGHGLEILGAGRRRRDARRPCHARQPAAALPRHPHLGEARRALADGAQSADDNPGVRRFAAGWLVPASAIIHAITRSCHDKSGTKKFRMLTLIARAAVAIAAVASPNAQAQTAAEFLQGQAGQPLYRLLGRRHLRSLWPRGRAAHRQAHSRQSNGGAQEHGGRRLDPPDQFHVHAGAQGRYRHRHHGTWRCVRAAVRHEGRAVRGRKISLGRQRQ